MIRRPKATHARPTPASHLVLTNEDAALLGVLSDRRLAAQLGVTARAVQAERQRRDIAPVAGGRKPAAGVRRTKGRTLWLTPDENAAIDAARGEQPWQDYAREAVLQRAGVMPVPTDPPTT